VVRIGTGLAIPGWATYATGLLLVLLTQMALVIVVFVFVILASRNATSVLPARDYVHIMSSRQRIYG